MGNLLGVYNIYIYIYFYSSLLYVLNSYFDFHNERLSFR